MPEKTEQQTNELSAKGWKAADLAEYQKNSIVSRQLIAKDAGNVTLFAFDKGQSLSEHTAPFDALIQVVDGKAEIFVIDQWHEVNSGEMILLPANKPHAVRAPERFKMILTMIRQAP